jgi:hypothetical protein
VAARTQLLEQALALLGVRRELLVRKRERLLGAAGADELDEPLLLQVEEQGVLLLQDLTAGTRTSDQGRNHQERQRSAASGSVVQCI